MGWMEKAGLVADIVFNPQTKGGFFSKVKSNHTIDYFEGLITEVNSSFLSSYSISKKRVLPSKNDILKELGKFHGIWHKQIMY